MAAEPLPAGAETRTAGVTGGVIATAAPDAAIAAARAERRVDISVGIVMVVVVAMSISLAGGKEELGGGEESRSAI